MPDLFSIPGIKDAEVARLKAAGFVTTDALWEKLAKDEKGTLERTAIDTGLTAARLASLLGADIQRDASTVQGGFVRRHWIDLSIVTTVVVLLWAFFLQPVRHSAGKLPGLVVMRVPLKQLPADAGRRTPYHATLIASPRTIGEPMLQEVEVLEIFPGQTPAASVAVGPEQMQALGRLLGSSNLYLFQRQN
jgi:hypothetical protein